jgi:hypothetical protein
MYIVLALYHVTYMGFLSSNAEFPKALNEISFPTHKDHR